MPPGFFQRMGWRLKAAPVPDREPMRPTEEELKQDQELVQKAISEAVTAALNNDTFTKSVAVHLAIQLQPALKSALDISAVEENLSKRLDEIQTATTARLSDLSTDLNNYKSNDKTAVLEEGIAQMKASLSGLGDDVTAIQNQITQQDATILLTHTTKLNSIVADIKTLQEKGPAPVGVALSNMSTKMSELAAELKTIQEQIASPDTSLLASHTTKLDAIAAGLITSKENTEIVDSLQKITSDLAILKTDIESGTSLNSTGLSGLTTQIASVKSAIDAQGTTLSDIKTTNSSSDILAGVKSSNESHASHTTALSTLLSKDKSSDITDLRSQVASLSSTISEIKSADASPAILAVLESSNKSHAAHASTLAEIKAATSNPAPVLEKGDLSTLETGIHSIISSIESQNATLSEIKTVVSTPAVTVGKTDVSGLEADAKSVISKLDAHTNSLSEIQKSSSGPEILAAIGAQDAVLADLKNTNSQEILAAIEALKADLTVSKAGVTDTNEQVKVLIRNLPKLDNETLLGEVKAVKIAVESIQIPKFDKSDIINEVKVVHALVSGAKDAQILAEVKEIKLAVEKNAAVKAEIVSENDAGVENKKTTENGSNGVDAEVKEVEEEVEA